MTFGRAIGNGFAAARDFLAHGLVSVGATPNMLTLSSLLFTLAASFCLFRGAGSEFAWTLKAPENGAYGRNAYLLLAGALLVLSCAGDMLDGAVARIGKKATTFGAFLDSTLDRFSDFFIFFAIAFYFACRNNVTYTLLPMLAIFSGLMISYTRARAEDLIQFCTVGYWQRGERMAAVIIAVFSYNIPALLWQQALLPMLTVWARIRYTAQVTSGKTPVTDPRKTGRWIDKLRLWRYPRGTWAYDIVTGLNIAWLIWAPINPSADPVALLIGM